jgi:hypothetical protein
VAACARCGSVTCHNCLTVVVQDQPLCMICSARHRMARVLPWDRRRELGTLRAFWQTCWATVTRPVSLFDGAPSEGSIRSSFLFALLASIVGYLPAMVLYAVLGWGVLATAYDTPPSEGTTIGFSGNAGFLAA